MKITELRTFKNDSGFASESWVFDEGCNEQKLDTVSVEH